MKTHDEKDSVMAKAVGANGQRLTRQKMEVFHYLQEHWINHPTAEEVYFGVKRWVPSISLATVYNCLESLVSCKLLNRLDIPGPHHYEMRGRKHDHFRCVACGKIFDLETSIPIDRMVGSGNHFEVIEYQLLLSGYCPKCKPHKKSST